MQVLLDSDVILDLVLRREPHFSDALELFRAIAEEQFTPFVTATSLLNVNYFAKKEKGRAFALIEIEKLLSLLSVCSTEASAFKRALTSPIEDFEDAVQHESALIHNLSAIITRNSKDFKNSKIPVYSPAGFLEVLKTERE